MAGDRPAVLQGTGWESTPYYQQAQQQQAQQQAQNAGPTYITTTTTQNPQSEFILPGGGAVSVAPNAPYPFGATRITERTEDTTGALSVQAGGQTYQIRQGVQPTAPKPVELSLASGMINPRTGEFMYQGQPEYKYYAEPESGSVIETFQGGKLIPTASGVAAVQVPEQRFFGVGPAWEQVEIHGGKVVEVQQPSVTQATTSSLLAAPSKQEIQQATGVGLPVDVAKFLESQGIDWGKEVPGWEQQVYQTGIAKTITGPEGSYFVISPLAGGVSLTYQPAAQQVMERMQITDYPTYSVVNRFKPGESTPYISEAIPTGSQFASQADMDKWFGTHPAQPAQYSTENIIVSALGFGQGSGLEDTTAAQFARLYGQGVQAVETAAKTAINIGTPLGAMQEAIATKAWEHPFEIQMPYQVRYAEEHPSDVLTTFGVGAVAVGGFALVPAELIGGTITAVAGEGIKTLFTPGYDPAKANQWQSEFIGGAGSAAVAGMVYGALRPEITAPSTTLISRVIRTGDIALATEASAFAGGATYTSISASLQGRQASISEVATTGAEAMMLALPFTGLSLRMETQAQQNYFKQLQEQAQEPMAKFTVAEKAGGTLEDIGITEAKEYEVPGVTDPGDVAKLMQMQAEQGVQVKGISITEGGGTVAYKGGTAYPHAENPFDITLKTPGGIEIPNVEVPSAFYGKEPGLPEMMTSGYVPSKVSADFNLQYKGLAPLEERLSFEFGAPAKPEVDISAAKEFFGIKAEINPFKDIQDIAYIKYPQISVQEAGIEQVFPWTEGRTAGTTGAYTMKLPAGAEQLEEVEPWYAGTGLEEQLKSMKISDYLTTGVKYTTFEPPEGLVVSPESYKGIMLTSGIEKIDFGVPKTSVDFGDLGVDIIDFRAPQEINPKITAGDRSMILGYKMQQQELLDKLAEDVATANSQESAIQKSLTKLQEQSVVSIEQVQQPLSTEATARAYGISPALYPYTVPQASEVSESLAMPKAVQLPSVTTYTQTFQPATTKVKMKEAEMPVVNIKQFTLPAISTKQTQNLFELARTKERTGEIDVEKFKDLFNVGPAESYSTFTKQGQTEITIQTPQQAVTWTPPTPTKITWTPPPPTKLTFDFPKGMGEIPPMFGRSKPFRMPKMGKARSTFAPISDLWSRTASEFMTGKIAHSPSLKVAQKFWKQTGGEIIPTAEMLSMKPKAGKPRKPFRMPKIRPQAVRKPKAARKPKGFRMQHVMKGFQFKKQG